MELRLERLGGGSRRRGGLGGVAFRLCQHFPTLRLEAGLLLLELTHELTLEVGEVVALALKLVVLGVPRVVRLLLKALHLLAVVRLEFGDACRLAPKLALTLGEGGLRLRKGRLSFLRRRAVGHRRGVEALELGVAILEELEIVPEIHRELLELLLGLRELRLLAAKAVLDVASARVELAHALLGERDELL